MQKSKQSFIARAAYWLKVVSLGLVLGLGLQFAQAWVAPTVAPPGGNVAGPLTTGANQVKTGTLTTGGLSAPSIVDSNNPGYYVNPNGPSVLSSLRVSTLAGANCDLKADVSGNLYCGNDAGGGVTSISAGSGVTLSPNPITATGTISVDPAYVQRRVSSTCAAGSSVRAINADGTVVCETDDTAAAAAVPSGTWCGSAYVPIQDNLPNSVFTCNGQNVLSGCPAGYTAQSTSTGSGEIRTCVKN